MSPKRRWAWTWRRTICRFFPLIYWPMDPREKDLSPQALSKVQDYMRNGGTMLIDTRDLTLGATRGADNPRRSDAEAAARRRSICRRWSRCRPIMC